MAEMQAIDEVSLRVCFASRRFFAHAGLALEAGRLRPGLMTTAHRGVARWPEGQKSLRYGFSRGGVPSQALGPYSPFPSPLFHEPTHPTNSHCRPLASTEGLASQVLSCWAVGTKAPRPQLLPKARVAWMAWRRGGRPGGEAQNLIEPSAPATSHHQSLVPAPPPAQTFTVSGNHNGYRIASIVKVRTTCIPAARWNAISLFAC